MPSDISVVVVNWNGGDLLPRSLASTRSSLLSVEVILVDNASTDGSAVKAHQDIVGLTLIQNDDNLGFARANNIGIRACTSPYVLLLNNDAILKPGALETLLDYMRSHPRVAVCGARLLNADDTVQPFTYGGDPTIGYLIRRATFAALGRSMHDWQTQTGQEVDWVAGTAMMVRAEAIQQCGLLDESFFMYFEDVEWCRRFRDRGWRVAYVPQAEVTHLNKRTHLDRRRQDRYYRSLRHYYRLHYGAVSRVLLELLLAPYVLARRLQS